MSTFRQIACAVLLVLASAFAGLIAFPRSYGHAYLWGQCNKPDEPVECRYNPIGRHGIR